MEKHNEEQPRISQEVSSSPDLQNIVRQTPAKLPTSLVIRTTASANHPDVANLRIVNDVHGENDITVWDVWQATPFRRPNPITLEDNFDYRRLSRHHNGPDWGWQVPSQAGKPAWDDQNLYPQAGPMYVAAIPQCFVGEEGFPYDSTRLFALDPIFSYRGGLDFQTAVAPLGNRPIRRFRKLVTVVQV